MNISSRTFAATARASQNVPTIPYQPAKVVGEEPASWTLLSGQDSVEFSQQQPRGQEFLNKFAMMQRANLAAGTRPSAAPKVAAGNDDDVEFSDLSAEERRGGYVKRMEAAGVKNVSNPPTEQQMMQYFGTLNSPATRGKAAQEYRDYAGAFHVHASAADSRALSMKENETRDIEYSADQVWVVNGKVYKDQGVADAAAKKAGLSGGLAPQSLSKDASDWKDVASRKEGPDGRKSQDCEGFAFLGAKLMQAAGYEATQLAGGHASGKAHALVVLKDPSGGESVVISNDQAFTGRKGTEKQLKQQGWEYGIGQGIKEPAWFEGSTQAEAQARMMWAEEPSFRK
jgi:hypothetical protein